MNKSQKGLADIILVVIIVVFLGVVGYFAFIQKSTNTENKQQLDGSTFQEESSVETQVRTAVEKVLSQSTLPNLNEQMPKGIKLLSISVVANNVTLNFSKEIISKGQGVFEDIFSFVLNAIHPIIQGEGNDPKYPELDIAVLVEGNPLNEIPR